MSLNKLRKLSSADRDQEKSLRKVQYLNECHTSEVGCHHDTIELDKSNTVTNPRLLNFMSFKEKRRLLEVQFPGRVGADQMQRGRDALQGIVDNLADYSAFEKMENNEETDVSISSDEDGIAHQNTTTSSASTFSDTSCASLTSLANHLHALNFKKIKQASPRKWKFGSELSTSCESLTTLPNSQSVSSSSFIDSEDKERMIVQ